jgi:hypothetical protein
MIAVTAGGPGLVVVGYEDGGGKRRRDAAVWSFDGVDWRRDAAESLTAPDGQEMRAVADVGGQVVAAGSDSASGDRDGAVWTSPDGVRWRRVVGGELGGTGNQEADGLAALEGRALVVGDAPSPVLSDQDAAVWNAG